MSRAASLYRLQQLDTEAEAGQRRLTEIAAALGETAILRQARTAARQAAAQVQEWSVRQRDLELEVQGIKSDIAAGERRLYGGSVRNPKELTDLQAKVASLKRLLERKEENLLEAMIAREEAEAAQAKSQDLLTRVEASLQAEQAALRAEAERLETRLTEIARDRQALLPEIKPDDLELYRFLRRAKGGLAVVLMRSGACSACGIEVPQGQLERGREEGLLTCGNCERILVPEAELNR